MDDPEPDPTHEQKSEAPFPETTNAVPRTPGALRPDGSTPTDERAPSSPSDPTHNTGGSIVDALAARDRLHSEVRYGDSTLRFFVGMPSRADACLLPDGTRTDARVVALPPDARAWRDEGRPVDPAACVWQRPIEGTRLARRGRVVIDPGAGLRFVDEPEAGDDWNRDGERAPSLERDLAASMRIQDLCRSEVHAMLLYAALCNTTWQHAATGVNWSCSWRSAGAVVAHVRGEGDYIDWYCNGGEGMVDEGVLAEIEQLGWTLLAADPDAGTD